MIALLRLPMQNIWIGLLLLTATTMTAQVDVEPITVQKIWSSYTFYERYIPQFNFMNDGRHYVTNDQGNIIAADLLGREKPQAIYSAAQAEELGIEGQVGDYVFSNDEKHLLLGTHIEQIYRHSQRGVYYRYDREAGTARVVADGASIMYPTFAPANDYLAYVKDNDLYIESLADGQVTRVTNDGEVNAIINGAADWVYEEEFTMDRAYEWNADGSRLAYIRYDERDVPMFTMTKYANELYPDYYDFKYPKVGATNAKVSVHTYEIDGGKKMEVPIDSDVEYVPRINWTQDVDLLVVTTLNRHQNELELIAFDTKNGASNSLLQESSNYYVDVHDHLHFLPGGKKFLWLSERSGHQHIYLHDLKGKRHPEAITSGDYDVTDFYGYDDQEGVVYYQAAKKTPTQREVYMTSIKDGSTTRLSLHEGYNSAQFSSNKDYFVLNHSTANTPPVHTIYDRRGQRVQTIEDNAGVSGLQTEYGTNTVSFMEIPTESNVNLHAYMIKPNDFDPNKAYPMLMYVYGGPGSQQVLDKWGGQNYWWFQMLADQGYVVGCVDNRGTGARGEDFKKMTYMKLGHYETIDQINAAKYLGEQPYIDASRIGIFGWSYGGYLSSLCLFKGANVFKSGIAVAPVTNWKWYDTIYTERFMRRYTENEKGYDENSPLFFADQLEGNYLLIHGGADDNVHVQHSMELSRALIDANKQFDFYIYPNDNHGIYFNNARRHLYNKMTNFILEKL